MSRGKTLWARLRRRDHCTSARLSLPKCRRVAHPPRNCSSNSKRSLSATTTFLLRPLIWPAASTGSIGRRAVRALISCRIFSLPRTLRFSATGSPPLTAATCAATSPAWNFCSPRDYPPPLSDTWPPGGLNSSICPLLTYACQPLQPTFELSTSYLRTYIPQPTAAPTFPLCYFPAFPPTASPSLACSQTCPSPTDIVKL